MLSVGAEWLRWDPHVHAPDTLFNDQFRGDWLGYLTRIEEATPAIRALGVTDYYLLDRYREVRKAKESGRLAACDLIFPNIELRLTTSSAKAPLNIHLLIDPSEPKHDIEAERFLSRLTFSPARDQFSCTPQDFERLGKRQDPRLSGDAAIREGARQFKVTFDDLRRAWEQSDWAQANLLVAVAGGSGDGTSGLKDAADREMRQAIEHFAHIIFSSSPQQREFWAGRHPGRPPALMQQTYGGLKPCLHGSDAHQLEKVGKPDQDRFCWIKGEASFDALRHACAVPDRAFVGPLAPPTPNPSDVATRVMLKNAAAWAMSPDVPLNPGLVAVIGARGSGKTALIEAIAAACDAVEPDDGREGFLERAGALLQDAEAEVTWGSGEGATKPLASPYAVRSARVRYLSQKFVDRLCDTHGMKDALLVEIERVVFESHSSTDRGGAIDFGDMREALASPHRRARQQAAMRLNEVCDQFNEEQGKRDLLPELLRQAGETKDAIARQEVDLRKLIPTAGEPHAQRLAEVTNGIEKAKTQIRIWDARLAALKSLAAHVSSVRRTGAAFELHNLQSSHRAAALSEVDWSAFQRSFDGDVDGVLEQALIVANEKRSEWVGTPPQAHADPQRSYISPTAELSRTPLALLTAESARLQSLVSIGASRGRAYAELARRIASENDKLAKLQERIEDHQGAKDRMLSLQPQRASAYEQVFASLLAEEQVLHDLYAPLAEKLQKAQGVLPLLAFEVERAVDVDAWAKQGEALLDLRKGEEERKGRGWLRDVADPLLGDAWRKGDASQIGAAMTEFRRRHNDDLLHQIPRSKDTRADRPGWLKDLARWLYGTSHVQLRYRLTYEGTDIRALSPGTRGIVALLLYLALDGEDGRPLLIDQPEENLDPRSIQQVLVPLFQEAKERRQVIMVTHNPNLVVNADADQVIVASCGARKGDGLPPITYEGGSLDAESVREKVCEILEGGREAFHERAKRLRL